MIKRIILLSICIALYLVSLSQSEQSKQINQLKGVLLYALKNNKTDTVSSLISSSAGNDAEIIKNIWNKICNEIPYSDTSRINLQVNLLGNYNDTIYLQFVPYFSNPKPIERSFESYSPIYKLIKNDQSLFINKVSFINREIDHIKYDTKVKITPSNSFAEVRCSLDFKWKRNGYRKAVFNLYPDLKIKELLLNNRKIEYSYSIYNLILSIPDDIANSEIFHLEISYEGKINDEDYMFILKDEGMLCFRPWLPNANNLAEYWLNTENAYGDDDFKQNYEVTIPSEFYTIADFGQLTDSKTIGNQRVERWKSTAGDHLGIIYGKWKKYEIKSVGNIKPIIYLTGNSEPMLDTLTRTASNLIAFYSNTFGEPSNNTFRIVDAPVYWNCENYITSNLGIIDHEMAHYWWYSLKQNWFFHGLTEYSIALFYQNKFGDENLYKRLAKYWDEYYAYITSNPGALLNNNPMLVYYLSPIMHYNLMCEMGRDNYLKMCQKLIEINYDRKRYSYNELLSLIKEISGQDYDWFFKQWRYSTVKPVYTLNYTSKEQGKDYEVTCNIHQKSGKYSSSLDIAVYTDVDTTYKVVGIQDTLTTIVFSTTHPVRNIGINPSNSLLAFRTKRVKSIIDFTSKEIEYSKAVRWSNIIALCDTIISTKPPALSKWYKAKANYQAKDNQLLEAKNSYENAIKYFDSSIERLDMQSSIYLELGKTCDLLKQRDTAIFYYNKIIQSMNSRPEAKAMALKYLKEGYVR